jgi:glycerol uptake facilitator-like aquaporin
MTLARRLAAEALGALLLTAAVVGSGIMAERLAAGNVAVALLGNTLATAAMLCVLITVLGPVSGAHMNPAVSLVMALRRAITPADAACYALVQVAGCVAGAMLAHAMFEMPALGFGATARAGPGQWLGEAVATFALVVAITGAERWRPAATPLVVAATVTAGYWFASSTSFANPAITVARSLSDSFAGIRPADAPAFIVAQLAGAMAGAILAGWLFAPARTGGVGADTCPRDERSNA